MSTEVLRRERRETEYREIVKITNFLEKFLPMAWCRLVNIL